MVPHLAPDAVIVSIAAGVRAADISEAFGGRGVARVMPTTAVAIGRGAASLYAEDAEALAEPRPCSSRSRPSRCCRTKS